MHRSANNKNKTEYLTFLVEDDKNSKYKKQIIDIEYNKNIEYEYKNARMTVDYYEDILFVRKINDMCDITNCTLNDILFILKNNPRLLKINKVKGIINPYDIKKQINLKIKR